MSDLPVIRLEFKRRTSRKFWEASWEKTSLTVRWGRIGSDGQSKTRKFPDQIKRDRELGRLVREKERKGYREPPVSRSEANAATTPETKTARDPKLEAAILKDPSSDEGFLVYGDWLQSQSDPRGELVAIQAGLAKQPKDKKLKNAEKKLLDAHREAWFGALAKYAYESDSTYSRPSFSCTWRLGFLDSVRISAASGWAVKGKNVDISVPDANRVEVDLLEPLLALPSARFLRELVIGVSRYDDECHFGPAVLMLGRKGHAFAALRSLVIGDFTYQDTELSWSHLGTASKLWKTFPKLEKVKLRAGTMTLGKIDLPELRDFSIETGGLSRTSLKAVVGARWPNLESLSLWFGKDHYGSQCEARDVGPILEGKGLKKVRHLGLKNSQFGNDLVKLLPDAKILRQLESLDISMSHVTDAGAAELSAHKSAFKHLKVLNLERCVMTKAGEKLVQDLAREVLTKDQQPGRIADQESDPDYRYAAVGE